MFDYIISVFKVDSHFILIIGKKTNIFFNTLVELCLECFVIYNNYFSKSTLLFGYYEHLTIF